MSKKEDTAFEQWKDEVSAKLNDEAKKAFDVLLSDESGAKDVFRGHMREQEFYTRLNRLDTERKSFEADQAKYAQERDAMLRWYQVESPKNAQLLEEQKKLAAKLASARQQLIDQGFVDEAATLGEVPGGVHATNVSPSNDMTTRELENLKSKQELFDKALPRLMADFGAVIAESVKGKWDVDPADVLQFSLQNGVDPRTAFAQLTYEEREKRAAKDLEDKLEKAREEGRRDAFTKQATPDHFRAAGPNILDKLKEPLTSTDRRARVAGAVQDFLEMGVGS